MQEAHAGRLFDHVGIRVRDVAASRAFYAAVLEPLGLHITASGDGWFSADELFVSGDESERGVVARMVSTLARSAIVDRTSRERSRVEAIHDLLAVRLKR